MVMKQLLLCICLVTALCSAAFAQSKIELQKDDTLRAILERQVGQPIDLRMKSGEKISGKLEKVGDHLAHVSQLTGADFYDAAVAIEEIAAVVVRVRAK